MSRATNAAVVLAGALLLTASVYFGSVISQPFAEGLGPTTTTAPMVIMVVIQPPLAAQSPTPTAPIPGAPTTSTSASTSTTLVAAPSPNTTQSPGPDPQPVVELQPEVEQVIAEATNDLRVGAGLAPLAIDAELQSYARAWAMHMAATGTVEHSAIETLLDGWVSVGENVGSGDQAQVIFQALVASVPHQSIMLGEYSDGGVGAVIDEDGVLWVCQVFASETFPTTTTAPEVTLTLPTLPEVTVPSLP